MQKLLIVGSINMVLTYAKYIDLMTALDEHGKGTLERKELQDAIFKHYISISTNKVFVAENMKRFKRRFSLQSQSKSKFKRERNAFRNFMDGGSVEQTKTTEDYVESNEL